MFPNGDLNLGLHGDTSPHESVCIQVEVTTGIEKQACTHTHFGTRCTPTKVLEKSCAGWKTHILVRWNGMFSLSLQQSRQLGKGWGRSGRVRVSVLRPWMFACLHLCI